MRRLIASPAVTLMMTLTILQFFNILPAKAQQIVSASTPRFGVNAEKPTALESAYIDVFMEAGWGITPSLLPMAIL